MTISEIRIMIFEAVAREQARQILHGHWRRVKDQTMVQSLRLPPDTSARSPERGE